MSDVEHVLHIQCRLGEGPLWHIDEEALYWVDIEAHCFHRYIPRSEEHDDFDVGLPVGALAFRRSGGLVMATRDGFAFWDGPGLPLRFIADPEPDKPGARFNDGAVDRDGRFWAGTMGAGFTSALYRLDPDGEVHTMESGIGISNGIGWSPDNTTMYYTDSPRQVIYAYDYDAACGTISNRRALIQTPDEPGVPDGLAVDSEGCVWSARYGGGKLVRYGAAGTVEQVVLLPILRPTSCTFGGPHLTDLYITSAGSAQSAYAEQDGPLAGDLFRLTVDVPGLAEPSFAG